MRTSNLLLLGLFVASLLCAANASWRPNCRNLEDGYMVGDSRVPSRYYVCYKGRVQTMKCARGQNFNDAQKACRSIIDIRAEEDAEVSNTTCVAETTTCSPPTTTPCNLVPETTTTTCEPATTTTTCAPATTTTTCAPATTTTCKPETTKPQTTKPTTTTCKPEPTKPQTTTCTPPPC